MLVPSVPASSTSKDRESEKQTQGNPLRFSEVRKRSNIGVLWSYVADRLIKPASTDVIRDVLANERRLLDVFDRTIANQGDQNRRTLDLLQDRINARDRLENDTRRLYERLLTETERRAYLEGEAESLRRIAPDQDARLVAMAAPLLRDMGVTLRNSASTLQVIANDNERVRPVVFLNRRMTSDIETSVVDEQSTLILVRIIQYNIETGWGKLRAAIYEGLLSFNVPADRKADVQAALIDAMDRAGNRLDTYIECLFVRSTSGLIKQAIIVGIRDLDEIDGGL